MRLCNLLIGGLSGTLSTLSFANDMEIGYEYGIHTLQSDYYSAGMTHNIEKSSFGLHRFVWFDTQGAMTSAVRGALNESAARMEKEKEVREAYRKGNTASYEYSWQQPAPVPTDGDTWALVIGSEGSLLSDTMAPQMTDPKHPSVLGLEYQSKVWSMTAAPVSAALGWGLRTYYYSHLPGSHSPLSIPLSASASSRLIDGVVPYIEYSRGMMGLFNASKFGVYSNLEAGVHWQFSPEWKAVLTYRKTHDEVTFTGNHPTTQHNTTLTMVGIRWTM